ncbi:hypothetical protein, partial [Faecalibaculum rodentium]|uniref:hypothetical protein n=1 Tax=Faecalibaculum rodentium TaxID=1702221 RepID=UPI0025B78219
GIRPFLDLRNYKGVTAPFSSWLKSCAGQVVIAGYSLNRRTALFQRRARSNPEPDHIKSSTVPLLPVRGADLP